MTTSLGGKPLNFKTVEELQERIDKYFAECDPHMLEIKEWVQARDKDGKLKKDEHGLNYLVEVSHKVMTDQIPYTVTGLALSLNTSRQTLLEYEGEVEGREKKDPRYADTIKNAKLKVHNFVEQVLYTPTPTGAIFNLKNNFGWKDKTEVDNSGEIVHKYEDMTDEQLEQAIKARQDKLS